MSDKKILVNELVVYVWKKRFLFLRSFSLFFILSIAMSFLTDKEYKAESVFMPMVSNEGGGLPIGQLGGLASLAGVDLGNTSRVDISPALYPNLLMNIDFQERLLETKFYIESLEDSVSYSVYYGSIYRPSFMANLTRYTIGLPSTLKRLIFSGQDGDELKLEKGFPYKKLSFSEEALIDRLLSQVAISPNDRSGLVTVTATMEDSYMSAQLVDKLIEILQEELVKYKSLKAENQYIYIKKLHESKRQEFLEVQKQLAKFNDRNILLATSASQIGKKNLQAEFDLVFDVYLRLSKQLEDAKIQLAKEKPLFLNIRPISIPIKPVRSKTKIVLMTFAILSFLFVCMVVLVYYLKPVVLDFKKSINQ